MDNEFQANLYAINDAELEANKLASDADSTKADIASASAYNGLVKNVNLGFLTNGAYTECLDSLNGYSALIGGIKAEVLKAMFMEDNFSNQIIAMYQKGDLTEKELIEISNEYMHFLLSTPEGMKKYQSLALTPHGESAGVFLAKKLGYSVEDEYDKISVFVQNMNRSFSEYLIDKNLMYTGEGVVEFLNTYNGLFAMFGYKMNYDNCEFDRSDQGLYFGTRYAQIGCIDCCNLYDWAARAVGLDCYAYGAGTHNFYGMNIDGTIPENRYNCYDINDPNYKNAKPGDILEKSYNSNAGHLRIIIGSDENGYYTVENGYRMEYRYYTFEELRRSGYRVSHLDAVYDNTSNGNKKVHVDRPNQWDRYKNSEYEAERIRSNPNGSIFLTPKVFVEEVGLSDEYQRKLIEQYNARNKRSDIPDATFTENANQVKFILSTAAAHTQPTGTGSDPNESTGDPSEQVPTPEIPDGTILPVNKFTEFMPIILEGYVNDMEISKSMVNYELINVNENVCNKFIEDLQEMGYIFENGVWSNGTYSIKLEINDSYSTMNIMMNIIK